MNAIEHSGTSEHDIFTGTNQLEHEVQGECVKSDAARQQRALFVVFFNVKMISLQETVYTEECDMLKCALQIKKGG